MSIVQRTTGALCRLPAAAAALLLAAGCAVGNLDTARALADAAVAYEARPAEPTHRLLVVGDSTAVGTGAGAPKRSVAGLLGRDHPGWAIVNAGRNGARLEDVVDQLQAARRDGRRYDTVLVLAGGNDVIRFTGWDAVRGDLAQIVDHARALAPRVVLMPSGNVGSAPFFHPPLNWLMSQRSRALHAIVRETAERGDGVAYVDLYRERDVDPFALQPERYHAADGLHPSDAGYALWRRALQEQAGF